MFGRAGAHSALKFGRARVCSPLCVVVMAAGVEVQNTEELFEQ